MLQSQPDAAPRHCSVLFPDSVFLHRRYERAGENLTQILERKLNNHHLVFSLCHAGLPDMWRFFGTIGVLSPTISHGCFETSGGVLTIELQKQPVLLHGLYH